MITAPSVMFSMKASFVLYHDRSNCIDNGKDNAIPIEGWISDPTDNDLLNLIPLLEGLQHTTDVRALLALRLGQPDTGA